MGGCLCGVNIHMLLQVFMYLITVQPWALLRLWGTHGVCVDSFPQVRELLHPEMGSPEDSRRGLVDTFRTFPFTLSITGEQHSHLSESASFFKTCFIFRLLWVFIATQAFL